MIDKKDILSFYKIERVLIKEEDFIYLLPDLELRDWISNYTITFPYKNMMAEEYTIIPHGCATLVFTCDKEGMHSNLFGPSTKPIVVGKKANQCNIIFIIEFQPAGLSVLTGIRQKEIMDKIIPFEKISEILNKVIIETLNNSKDINEFISNVDKLFLANKKEIFPKELKYCIEEIIKNMGNIAIKELASEVFFSERQLNRIFNQYMGMSIKFFSRLVRVNKAIRLLHNPENNITNVCDLSGFYDISHFIHDFKSICGITPQEYCNNMSDFYSEIAKF